MEYIQKCTGVLCFISNVLYMLYVYVTININIHCRSKYILVASDSFVRVSVTYDPQEHHRLCEKNGDSQEEIQHY